MTLAKTVALLAGLLCGGSALGQLKMTGAGATFPYPIYSKWFDEYAKVDPSVRFNYQSIGSGGGQKQIIAQTVDFGASDGPMSDENLAKAPAKILHIPSGREAAGFRHHRGAPVGRERDIIYLYRLPEQGEPGLEIEGRREYRGEMAGRPWGEGE
jgi:phosphate transport system substrate-binding protein